MVCNEELIQGWAHSAIVRKSISAISTGLQLGRFSQEADQHGLYDATQQFVQQLRIRRIPVMHTVASDRLRESGNRFFECHSKAPLVGQETFFPLKPAEKEPIMVVKNGIIGSFQPVQADDSFDKRKLVLLFGPDSALMAAELLRNNRGARVIIANNCSSTGPEQDTFSYVMSRNGVNSSSASSLAVTSAGAIIQAIQYSYALQENRRMNQGRRGLPPPSQG